jgi:hypothetical protein
MKHKQETHGRQSIARGCLDLCSHYHINLSYRVEFYEQDTARDRQSGISKMK